MIELLLQLLSKLIYGEKYHFKKYIQRGQTLTLFNFELDENGNLLSIDDRPNNIILRPMYRRRCAMSVNYYNFDLLPILLAMIVIVSVVLWVAIRNYKNFVLMFFIPLAIYSGWTVYTTVDKLLGCPVRHA